HPFPQRCDVANGRRRLLRARASAEVHELAQCRCDVLRPDAVWHPIVISQVEARTASEALFGDSNALGLGLALAFGGDSPVLAFALIAQIVELALHGAAAIAIVFVVDPVL